jgi:hypothetical protein
MNAVELYRKNEDGTYRKTGVWACINCRVVYRTQDDAEQCCKPRQCAECDREAQKGWTLCPECLQTHETEEEKARYDAAEKIPASEYDGPVYDGAETYFSSVSEYLDEVEDGYVPLQPYLWACHIRRLHVDAKQQAYDIAENVVCDADCEHIGTEDVKGLDELEAAIEAWNNAQTAEYWVPDVRRAVILSDESEGTNG